MPEKQLNIRVSTKSDNPQSWKELNSEIKNTRSELVRLQSEGKVGTAEWKKYGDSLRDLIKQKQIVQRQTKLTSQQLLSLSRDLVIVGTGFKNLVEDISEIATTKKPIDELAMSLGNVAFQALTLAPAITALSRSFTALVGTSVTTWIASVASFLGILLGGITAVGSAIVLMIHNFMNLGVVINAWKRIFAGENVFDVWTETTKILTAGIIDLTGATEDSQKSIRGVLAKEPEANSGKLTGIKPNSGKKEKEKNETDEFLKDLRQALEFAKTFRSIDSDLLVILSEKTEQQLTITSAVEDQIKLGKFLNDITGEGNKLISDRLKDIQEGEEIEEKRIKDLLELSKLDFEQRINRGEGRAGVATERRQTDWSIIFDSFISFANEFTSIFNLGADSFTTKLINGLQSAFSFANSIISLLNSIFSATTNIFSGGLFGFLGSLFDEGGYTGEGSKHEPAGIVHRGEFVINKESTKEFYPLLELINGKSKNFSFSFDKGGYASGRYVPNIEVRVSTQLEKVGMYKVYLDGKEYADRRGDRNL